MIIGISIAVLLSIFVLVAVQHHSETVSLTEQLGMADKPKDTAKIGSMETVMMSDHVDVQVHHNSSDLHKN